MTTTTSSNPDRRARHASAHRRLRPALIGAGIFLLVCIALLAGLRVARAGVLPGVEVAGLELGGLDEASARSVISGHGERRQNATLTVVREADEAANGAVEPATITTTGGELGYRLDLDATTRAVMRRGRQLNPFAALFDQLRAFGGTIRVDPVEQIDEEALDSWTEEAAEVLAVEPVEGSLEFEGTTITRVDPAPGAAVVLPALREEVLRSFLSGTEATVVAVTEPVEPVTTAADVSAVEAAARKALSGDVSLHRNGTSVTFTPDEIAAVLTVRLDGTDGGATLALTADAERVEELFGEERIAALEHEPVDASFDTSGATVVVVDHRDGFEFNAEKAAEQLVAVATSDGARSAELDGDVRPPSLTTQEAGRLGITERVSTFTTHYPCCQSRVRNIHRIAELVDGVIIEPGDTFSVNDFVGPRTVEKGFAPGGAIFDGEFVEQIGGGVSQFATTMFNAAFFGGYAIPDYKAHSYYISRYPIGREATLNYPNVDLKVRNNSPHGLLVRTSVTGTSVTVSFYGTKWVEVSDSTGPQRNHREPPVEYRENPDIPAGEERVVQGGRPGFDITVIRVLKFPDGREERESYFTRYLPEPQIIERNSTPPPEPGDEQPPPDGEPTPSPSPSPEPSPEPAS